MLTLALLAAAMTIPAAAEPDVRCVALLSAAVEKVPEAQKAGVIAGVMYFVGRIDAKAPGLDYHAALKPYLDPAKGAGLVADLPRCTGIIQERGQMLQAVGSQLTAEAPKKR